MTLDGVETSRIEIKMESNLLALVFVLKIINKATLIKII